MQALMQSRNVVRKNVSFMNILQGKRTFMSQFRDMNQRRLMKKVESDAKQFPQDPQVQLRYVRALNKSEPRKASRIIEENPWMEKLPEFQREYMKAIVGSGAIDSMDKSMLPKISVSSSAEMHPVPFGNPFAMGSKPLQVQVVSASWKDKMLDVGARLVVAFVVISALVASLGKSDIVRDIGKNPAIQKVQGSDVRFSDVKGVDEAKAELEEIVEFLKDPQKFTRLGGKLPRGVLLNGAPGTGKTLMARAVAGEANVPFYFASGSDFEEMYVGLGAKRVRELFKDAKKHSPCIIFIDEIDAIGSKRSQKEHAAMKMTLNSLLVEMDGFKVNNNIVVIGATNVPEVLDDALTRPGRFDRSVNVSLPDVLGRSQILDVHAAKLPLDKDVSIDVLARATPGMSGAELSNMVNEAALCAAGKNLKTVNMAAFEYAKDKIIMGAEKKSSIITPECARNTAFHEGGHALVAMYTKGAHPVYKATIMPRGPALGMVSQLPKEDQKQVTREQILAKLDIYMGGRVAEEILSGNDHVSTGASSDFAQATNLARRMVMHWGMSEKIGCVAHQDRRDISASRQTIIDEEVKRICDEAYLRAKTLLLSKRHELDLIANALIKYETLSGEELHDIINGKAIVRKVPETITPATQPNTGSKTTVSPAK